MLKKFIILLLSFGAGIAGNLLAAYIQENIWMSISAPLKLLGTVVGTLFMLILLLVLDSKSVGTWNVFWHRFWYLLEIKGSKDIMKWKTSFSRLQGTRRFNKTSIIRTEKNGRRFDLVEYLSDNLKKARDEGKRILVTGEPGSGKTTSLERLTFELASKKIRRLGFGGQIPLLIRLGNFQRGSLYDFIVQSIDLYTKGRSGKILGKAIDELLRSGRFALVFDALDESMGDQRHLLLAELKKFFNSPAYEKCSIVISSRTREVPYGVFSRFETLEIQELESEAIDVFIDAYRKSEDKKSDIMERLKGEGLLKAGGLGRNPFWLKLIIESGVFGGNKGYVLDAATTILLEREWDDKAGAKREWNRIYAKNEQLSETKGALSWLAFKMSENGAVFCDNDWAVPVIRDWLSQRNCVEKLRPQDVLALGRDAQLLDYGEGIRMDFKEPVKFRHRLIQEFLAAWCINGTEGLLPQDLIKTFGRDGSWGETLVIVLQLAPKPEAFITEILLDGSQEWRISLALRLLKHCRMDNEFIVEMEKQILKVLAQDILNGDITKYKKRAKNLTDVADDDIISLLLKLMNWDARSKYGIEILRKIAIIFGETKCEKAAEALEPFMSVDFDSDDTVHKALESIGEPALDVIIRRVDPFDNWAINILKKIGNKKAIDALIRVWDRPEWNSLTYDARDALVDIGESAVLPLIATLQNFSIFKQDMAARTLGFIGDKRAVDPLIHLLKYEGQNPKYAAVFSLGRLGDRKAVLPLIEILNDPDACVRIETCRALGELNDERALAPLNEILNDSYSSVRESASEAIKKILNRREIEVEGGCVGRINF